MVEGRQDSRLAEKSVDSASLIKEETSPKSSFIRGIRNAAVVRMPCPWDRKAQAPDFFGEIRRMILQGDVSTKAMASRSRAPSLLWEWVWVLPRYQLPEVV
jgi:hypothetical protein